MDNSALTHASHLFRLLATGFRYPTQPAFEYLKSLAGELTLHWQGLCSTPVQDESLKDLGQKLAATSLEDWQVEYTGLFIYARQRANLLPVRIDAAGK